MKSSSSHADRLIIADGIYEALKTVWWFCAALGTVAFVGGGFIRSKALHTVTDETWALEERLKRSKSQEMA